MGQAKGGMYLVETPADVLVMESTYGLPHFRFPPANLVAEQLVPFVDDHAAQTLQARGAVGIFVDVSPVPRRIRPDQR